MLGLLVLRCRTGKRSRAELQALDALGITLPCWQTAAALTQVEPRNKGSASIVLGLSASDDPFEEETRSSFAAVQIIHEKDGNARPRRLEP